MAKYTEEFWHQAIEKALKQGIKPTVRELKISRNTLRDWVRVYKNGGMVFFVKYHRTRNRTPFEIEKFVVYLKEKDPTITLKGIQKVIKQKKGKVLSLQGIQGILKRYGMTRRGLLPFKGEKIPEIQKGVRLAHILLEQKNIKKAAAILNSLPALTDFSILREIPSQFLCLRRQAEQLETLWGILPMQELYRKAKQLRKSCKKEKLLFTEIFVTSLEMNALNFLGYPAGVFTLYKKYSKYLHGLPTPLKYLFFMECLISLRRISGKYPEEMFKNFPYALSKFVSKLPDWEQRVQAYNMISTYFETIGKIDKSLKWMKKLLQESPPESKKEYLPEYLSLLAAKGSYSEVLRFRESFSDFPTPLFLKATLARANALLGMGRAEEAFQVALNSFYKAEEEHLRPAMAIFTFFISCTYSALKETKKKKKYLKTALHFSKNKIGKLETVCLVLLGFAPSVSSSRDIDVQIISLYLLACRTLRAKDYLKAYRLAKKRGLLGFFHRITLLHPEIVVHLLKRGKETYLPQEFLNLPIFKEELPMYKLFLLTDKESVFYGNRKINISPRSKDFHLLVYLFLNRQKYLNKETLFDIFYKKTKNPVKSLTKALSRIRRILNLSKGALSSKRGGILFNSEAKIDLEEFEQSFKMGKILEKVGEVERALREYRACFALYKKGPFKQMGYYYNFAEERRTIVRNMFNRLCNALITNAKNKERSKTVRRIEEKFKKEGLVFDKEI